MSDDQHIWHPDVAFEDGRGTITDLLEHETFEAVSILTSVKGAVRGNHFHQETMQVLYVLSGKLRLVTQMPGESIHTAIAGVGDLVRTPPIERHAFVALEDSSFIVFTKGPRSGADFESDTHRLTDLLIQPQ